MRDCFQADLMYRLAWIIKII